MADVRCLLDGDDPVGRCRVDESLTFREGFEEGIASLNSCFENVSFQGLPLVSKISVLKVSIY